MNLTAFRLLIGICAAVGPVVVLAADAPAKADKNPPAAAPAPAPGAKVTPPASAPAAAPDTDPELLKLPKIEVTATRMKELDREIKKLDKAIVREKKKVKSTELDKALNNPKLVEAAAIFGGNTSDHLQAVAAARVRFMEAERDLLSDMKVPRTLQDYKMLEKELEEVRTMQRELDLANH